MSLDAERALLGTAMLYRDAVALAGNLAPEDFRHPLHGAAWGAIVALDADRCPTDAVSVAARLQRAGQHRQFRAVVGAVSDGDGDEQITCKLASWLIGMADQASIASSATHYARLIAECATLQRLREIGQQIAADAAADGAEASEVVARAEEALLGATSRIQTAPTLAIRECLSRAVKRIEARWERKQAVTGVPSGFPALDEVTGGFQPGHLTVIAARPGMGKTALGLNLCVAAGSLAPPMPSLIFSLEMSEEELTERGIASDGGIDSWRLRTGHLDTPSWLRLTSAASRLAQMPLTIVERAGLRLSDVRQTARRWRMQHRDGLGLVAVDYLQLVVGASRGKNGNREQEIAEISRGLKALAKELRVPVIALAQLNRAVEARADKRPQLSDLRESGGIEQDADEVIFIYRDDAYHRESPVPGTAELIFGKNRHGMAPTIPVKFTRESVRFAPMHEPEMRAYVEALARGA